MNRMRAHCAPTQIPSVAKSLKNWSGRGDSNPRPQPWQGCALPLSYTRILNQISDLRFEALVVKWSIGPKIQSTTEIRLGSSI